MEKTIGIPQESLRSNSSDLWVSENSELKIQEVKVKWRTDKKVLISKGVKTGDKIISSYLSTPVPGMKLKLFDPSSKKRDRKNKKITNSTFWVKGCNKNDKFQIYYIEKKST